MTVALDKHRAGIVRKQVAAGKEFKGCPFYSKPDVIHFKASQTKPPSLSFSGHPDQDLNIQQPNLIIIIVLLFIKCLFTKILEHCTTKEKQ